MSYKVLACGLSDVGLVRQNNEDVWAHLPDEQFFVLADGMGGHQAGEIAAKEAVETLCNLFKKEYSNSYKTLEESKQIIEATIRETNQHIYQMSFLQDDLHGMGTTLCCFLLHPEGLIYAHVGDSRIYRFRYHRLRQLTLDHSLLREMIDSGQLNEEQAEDFHYKNIITKAIGTEPDVDPTIDTDSLLAEDTILMCSDGLTDMLSHEEIQQILRDTPPQDAAKHLIKAAKQKGGNDNITIVIVNIQEKYGKSNLSRS